MLRMQIKLFSHFLITTALVLVPEAAHLHANAWLGVGLSPCGVVFNDKLPSVSGGAHATAGLFVLLAQPGPTDHEGRRGSRPAVTWPPL